MEFYFIATIDYISENEPPLIVTAQELCREQYDIIRFKLASRGYEVVGQAGVSRSTDCNGQDGAINMVASTGTSTGGGRGRDRGFPRAYS